MNHEHIGDVDGRFGKQLVKLHFKTFVSLQSQEAALTCASFLVLKGAVLPTVALGRHYTPLRTLI